VRTLFFGAVLSGMVLTSLPHAAMAQSATFDAVKARGSILCGVNGTTAGYSLPDSQGVYRGIDVDGCRAVAAALLGDANKIRIVRVTAQSRFTALQSGEIDMLVSNTTWTLGREASLGLTFAGINVYDGQGFMVKRASGVKSAKDLGGATICVQPGTTTELNLADYFRSNKIAFQPVIIQDAEEIQRAFLAGRCDAFTNDASSLAAFRSTQGAKAEELVLLPEIISKEPLGPVVRKGDQKWFDLVRWSLYAQLAAEEYGVNAANVDKQLAESGNPDVQRLLGKTGDLGKALGVDNAWAFNIIKQVGNYGEMWDRHITPIGVPRGPNELWTKGGLHYAPPLR